MRAALYCLVALLMWPAVAAAEGQGASLVAEGRRLAQEARFEEALTAFDQAAGTSDLTAEDLAALLEGRALVHHAQRNDAAFDRSARRLASLVPDYTPSRRVPPRLARRLRAALEGAQRLEIEASAERVGENVVVDVESRNDPGQLVERIVVTARAGDGAFTERVGPRASFRAAVTEGVWWFARALGPGGVVVGSVGSRDSPEVMPAEQLPPPNTVIPPHSSDVVEEDDTGTRDPTTEPSGTVPGTVQDDDTEAGLPVWPFVVGGVILAGVLVAVIAALAIPGNDTSIDIPGHPL